MDTETFDLAAHQEAACAKADEIAGLALRLRARLKAATNLPLPATATDDLIRQLTIFVAEAERFPR